LSSREWRKNEYYEGERTLGLTEKMLFSAKNLYNRLKRILLRDKRNVLFGARHFFGIPHRYLKFTFKLQRNSEVNFSGDLCATRVAKNARFAVQQTPCWAGIFWVKQVLCALNLKKQEDK
jgi:hypothetical protein